MTNQELTKASLKYNTMSIAELIEEINQIRYDGDSVLFDIALCIIGDKMTENEYQSFCDTL
jgi:hypothetical protein